MKLLSLLATFSPWEMQHLKDFVRSPYFNKQARLVDLFDTLHIRHPDMEELPKEALFEAMYPDKSFDAQLLYDGVSQLTRLIERFLMHQRVEDDFAHRVHFLLPDLLLRDRKRFLHEWKRQAKVKPPFSVPQAHFYQYEHYKLAVEAQGLYPGMFKEAPFDEMVEELNLFYLTLRLRYACLGQARAQVFNKEKEAVMVEQILAFLASQPFFLERSALLKSYYLLYKLQIEGIYAGEFQAVVQEIQAKQQEIPEEYQREIYSLLTTLCIRQINLGEEPFREILFQLYQWQLTYEMMFQEGHLSARNFKNIVALGLKLKKFEWVEAFIQDYGHRVSEDARSNALAYNRATLFFARGEYEKVRKELREVYFSDVVYQLGANVLLIKVYVELGEFDVLFSLLDSFSAFVRRNKAVPSYQKKLYATWITFVRKFARIKVQVVVSTGLVKFSQIRQFRKRLSLQKQMVQHDWLSEQVDRLIERYPSSKSH
ncbi:MAG: hypothetical protein AAFP89_22615 [Bacteroidota bacterium]